MTSTDYAHPYRPAPIRALNAVGRVVRAAPTWSPGALVDAARRAEGLRDLGPPDVDGPLDVLCRSIAEEADLHPLGAWITRGRLVGVLRNRLRATALRAADPAIAARRIRAPLVITGLQRTGTTLLHRLLGAVPALRALRSWEGLQPVPLRGAPTGDRDPRRRQARLAERGLKWMAPDFFAVHPVEADGLEEEVLLLDHSLLSTVPEATLRVPTFSKWLEAQDQAPAYAMLRDLLQLLEPAPEARWVLKTPHHLEWLDVLFDRFPDATVVHTHRDPVVTLASFCSMVAHGRGVMSDRVDPHEIGRDWLAKTGRMVDRALATRAARADQGFVDVAYADLMADPVGVVRRIVETVGLTWDEAVERSVRERLAASPKERHGRHTYALGDFGLTEQQVAARFAAYRKRFVAGGA